jgi:hypothetical protein
MTITSNTNIIRVTTSKPDASINFFKDVATMNHVLNEYILPEKLVAVSRTSVDGLEVVTTLNFSSHDYLVEFLTDPIIKKFSDIKKEYNKLHNISFKTEAVNG